MLWKGVEGYGIFQNMEWKEMEGEGTVE